LERAADHNGWYNHAVGYGVSARSDATSGIDGCQPDDTYSGPDSSSASVSRSCTDSAGNTGSDSKSFQYDATAPTVSINLSRDPDHGDWFNHAVGYRPVGSDATSGIESCQTGASYAGPDTASASVSRTCTDNAGNVGTGTRGFKYDATAPLVTVTPDRAADHGPWYNHSLTLSTDATDA